MISIVLAATLRLAYTRESLTASYRHYEQTIDGRVVVGADVIEETRNGQTRVIHERLARSRWGAGAPGGEGAGAPLRDDMVYVNVAGEPRLASKEVIHPRPLEPHAIYRDAATGEI